MSFREGDRVVLRTTVERFPFALVPAGSKGTVVFADGEALSVHLDDHYEGLLAWGNSLDWFGDAEGMTLADAERELARLENEGGTG